MEGKLILHFLLILLSTTHATPAKRKVINIFDHQKEDDIIELRSGNGRMFNALHRNDADKWPKSEDGNVYIPYTISKYAGYTPEEHQNLTEAIKRINSNTCIRFVPWQGEENYIEIVNIPGAGCATNVGRARGKEQLLLQSTPAVTCMTMSSVLHELMHITGLWHEHMRNDRDRYIKVHYENINPSRWRQFEKLKPINATTYNVPYDYTSIMHYGKTAFSNNKKITMETWDPRYQDIIGKAEDASPSDYKKICEIYQCSECKGASMYNANNINTPPPQATPNNECWDKYPSTCKLLEDHNWIDCMHGRDIKMCCGTCQRWVAKHGLSGNWIM